MVISRGHGRWWSEFFAIILITRIFLRGSYVQYINFPSLSDKESVIVGFVIPDQILRKQEKIKATPVLTSFPGSLS